MCTSNRKRGLRIIPNNILQEMREPYPVHKTISVKLTKN